MNACGSAMLLGAVTALGVSLIAVSYSSLSRAARNARNFIAIGFGYVFLPGLAIGSLVLMRNGFDYFRIFSEKTWHCTLISFGAIWGCAVFIIGRRELAWRKMHSQKN